MEWLVSVIAELRSDDEEQPSIPVPMVLADPISMQELVGATSTFVPTSSLVPTIAPAIASTSNSNLLYTSSDSFVRSTRRPPPMVPRPTAAAALSPNTLFLNASSATTSTPNNQHVLPEWGATAKECVSPRVMRLQGDLPSYDQVLEQQQRQQQLGQQLEVASNLTTARPNLGEIEARPPSEELPQDSPAKRKTWSTSTRTPSLSGSGLMGILFPKKDLSRTPSMRDSQMKRGVTIKEADAEAQALTEGARFS